MSRITSPSKQWSVPDRLGAASGAAYPLLIIVGNQMAMGGSTDPHPSGAVDLASFRTAPTGAAAAGFAMEVLGFLVFMFFLGWIGRQLRARGGAAEWLAGTAVLAATVSLAVKIASVMPMSAGFLDARELNPTEARFLTDMNAAAFVVTFLTFGVFLTALGLAVLASGYLGRFAGWSAVVVGLLGVALTLATQADPVNSNPLPFLAGLLWLLVVGVRLAWRGPRPAGLGEVTSSLATATA